MATSDAPVEIGHIALTVRDLDALSAYYQRAIGLHLLNADGESARLGTAAGTTLLELRRDRAARPRSPREAGLFHTAFLMPSRADLARWLRNAAATRELVQGASDHLVSEAIYLGDPEGNGIEIYVDRPRPQWPFQADGTIGMVSDPLDYADLASAGDGPWKGVPDGTVVGHVHLQVGQLPETETFYGGTLGLALTSRYPGANFFGWGGYHHHFGTNIWSSRGAGKRTVGMTGLAEVVLQADPAERDAIAARAGASGERFTLADPWGTAITVTTKGA